jgi:hypothetical protein
MRVIPTNAHGVLDYLVGLLLIAAPWLFGFYAGGVESLVPILVGVLVIGYSLFTDYEFGAVRTIPMPTHLALDGAGGLFLLLSPWLFGFAHVVWWPHVLVGAFEIIAALLTEREPVSGRTPLTASEAQRTANPRRVDEERH